MRTLLSYLPALGCGLMMVVMMRAMSGGRKDAKTSQADQRTSEAPPDKALEAEVASLREEIAILQSKATSAVPSQRSSIAD